jgi:cobyrinic acid a,c-diamide synthase
MINSTTSRLVIAGTCSGTGKTTVMVAITRALKQRGLSVVTFKVGPDYLDPTYHRAATGAVSHTIDGWMMDRETVIDTFMSATQGADIALIEGVMGLFDGASASSDVGSTAQIAKWLEAPVLLVIDASGMARTVAAIVNGCSSFDPDLRVSGVLCNRVGSRGHLALLKSALVNTPLIGGLPKEPALCFPERHLGLHSAAHAGITDEIFDAWGQRAAEWVDIDHLMAIARSARPLQQAFSATGSLSPNNTCRIGYALDEAFHFYYEANLRLLRQGGAELVPFSPIYDQQLPPVDGLYFGGGYPELFADQLSKNASMREQLRAFAARGGPIYAECGGLMFLAKTIRTTGGNTYEMANLIPGEISMCERLQALGYVEVETREHSLLGPPGTKFRGHQFRYSSISVLPPDLEQIYILAARRGGEKVTEGYRCGSVLASYVHAHWASNPAIPAHFVEVCRAHAHHLSESSCTLF